MSKELIEQLNELAEEKFVSSIIKIYLKQAADEIERWQKNNVRLARDIERLEGALLEIRDSKFCNYENTGSGQYGIGVTDGHRFCSNIAKEALDKEQKCLN